MFDRRVRDIIDFDALPRQRFPLDDRERLFAGFASEFFSARSVQPNHLTNYGFGIVPGVFAVIPYNLSKLAKCFQDGVPEDDVASRLLNEFDTYPILAGSAVFLGVDHALCEDLDFIQYVNVGNTDDQRRKVAFQLREQVRRYHPETIEISINRPSGPKNEVAHGDRIQRLLDRFLPVSDEEEIARAVARLGFVQFEWSNSRPSQGKPITVRVHYIHDSLVSTDIHPYQELHACGIDDFLHAGRHWLVESFGHYFTFLRGKISEVTIDASPIKAAKRAVVMFGMIGDLDSQAALLALVDDYPHQDAAGQRSTVEKIKIMVDDLRRDVEFNMTNWEE